MQFHDNFMRFRQSTHLTNYSNLRFYIAVSRNNTDTPTTTLRYIVNYYWKYMDNMDKIHQAFHQVTLFVPENNMSIALRRWLLNVLIQSSGEMEPSLAS